MVVCLADGVVDGVADGVVRAFTVAMAKPMVPPWFFTWLASASAPDCAHVELSRDLPFQGVSSRR